MTEPDYVVIRDPDHPGLSGKWYNRNYLPPRISVNDPVTGRRYTPTPFIEVRDDGAVAQVWMPATEDHVDT